MTLKFEQNPKKLWHGITQDGTRRHGKAREDTTRHEKIRQRTRIHDKAREDTARHEKARARGHGARGQGMFPTRFEQKHSESTASV